MVPNICPSLLKGASSTRAAAIPCTLLSCSIGGVGVGGGGGGGGGVVCVLISSFKSRVL